MECEGLPAYACPPCPPYASYPHYSPYFYAGGGAMRPPTLWKRRRYGGPAVGGLGAWLPPNGGQRCTAAGDGEGGNAERHAGQRTATSGAAAVGGSALSPLSPPFAPQRALCCFHHHHNAHHHNGHHHHSPRHHGEAVSASSSSSPPAAGKKQSSGEETGGHYGEVATRDAGVQVSPKRDSGAQCTLGARTLVQLRRRGLSPWWAEPVVVTPPTAPPTAPPSTPPPAVRVSLGFMRPPRARPGLYSPVSPRLLPTLPPGAAPRLELPDLSGEAARGPVGVVVSTQQAKGGQEWGAVGVGGQPAEEETPAGAGPGGGKSHPEAAGHAEEAPTEPRAAVRPRSRGKPGADRDKKPGADPGAELPAAEQAAKPGADLPKPGAESGKATKEPGKPGAELGKPGAELEKPGAGSTKPGAESEKPGVESEKPAGETGKTGVDSEKAGAEPRGEQGAQVRAFPGLQDPLRTVGGARFQFLEQKYGYYHCRVCNVRWESAYVWCVAGTSKVYFKQLCRGCSQEYNPYRVEEIVLKRRSGGVRNGVADSAAAAAAAGAVSAAAAAAAAGGAAVAVPGVDLSRPHRQELCGRCRGRRLSCDHTFSFKYLV